jgi:hypothetical protein
MARVEASILVKIKLIDLRCIVRVAQLLKAHGAERRHSEHCAVSCSRGCAAPDPQCAVSITTFCEGGVDNGQGAGEDKGTAQTLNRARRELDFGPRSKATGKRGKGVQCKARDEYATSPEQIGCATAGSPSMPPRMR